jgi:hypothetical protein
MGFTADEAGHTDIVNIMKYGTWGTIHEIGHNHQWNSWTLDGTEETGCNWFSIYVNQNVSLSV